jgi:hypothetical protein
MACARVGKAQRETNQQWWEEVTRPRMLILIKK